MQHLEEYAGKPKDEIIDDPLAVSVIGIRGAKIVFGSMKELETSDTDWKARRYVCSELSHLSKDVPKVTVPKHVLGHDAYLGAERLTARFTIGP